MKQKKSFKDWLSRKLFHRNRGSVGLRLKFSTLSITAKICDCTNKKLLKGGRYALLNFIPKGGKGVEVGVWKGDFSEALLQYLNPSNLTLVDPWKLPEDNEVVFSRAKSGKPIDVDQEVIENQNNADKVYQFVQKRFSSYPYVNILRSSSLHAAQNISAQTADWVYIDGSHYYDDVRDDLNAWLPKLNSGGVLFGDDYYWRTPNGEYSVKKAVDEFISKHSPKSWVVFRGKFLIQL